MSEELPKVWLVSVPGSGGGMGGFSENVCAAESEDAAYAIAARLNRVNGFVGPGPFEYGAGVEGPVPLARLKDVQEENGEAVFKRAPGPRWWRSKRPVIVGTEQGDYS